MIQFCFAEITI